MVTPIQETIVIKNEHPKAQIAIEAKDLVKIYNQGAIEVLALRGLNATFYRGEIAVIEGSSGCGKSTLGNILCGLDRQSAGNVYFFNKDGVRTSLAELNNEELEKFRSDNVGIVFQFMNLIPTLTARENVELPLLFNDVPEQEKKARALKLLDQTKIVHRANHKPGQLSGGEQQRVAIAAALINDPQIIVADEPTGNLDTKTAQEMIEMFKTINNEFPDKTIIIVSHDRAFRRIANRILFIKDGVIYDEQVPSKLAAQTQENLPPQVVEEMQHDQQRIMELEQKLRKMEKIFKDN